MDVDHFRKKQRHQQVAVERLNDQVGDHQVHEGGGPTPLEPRDQGHRYGHDCRPDIRNDHRKSNQHGQQGCPLQVQRHKGEPGDKTDDQDLPEFAPDIVTYIGVHLAPDLGRQFPVFGQQTANPGNINSTASATIGPQRS